MIINLKAYFTFDQKKAYFATRPLNKVINLSLRKIIDLSHLCRLTCLILKKCKLIKPINYFFREIIPLRHIFLLI